VSKEKNKQLAEFFIEPSYFKEFRISKFIKTIKIFIPMNYP